MENIKHIFFDLDNTLWDYRKNAKLTLVNLFTEYDIENTYGKIFNEFYEAYYLVNQELWDGYREKTVSKEELHRRRFPETFEKLGIQNFGFSAEMEIRFMNEVADSQHLVEGTEEILEYLKGKYELHILSNGFEEVTHKKINGCIIKDYISTISTSESAGIPKPDPKAFQTAIDKSGAKISESLYVGDDWIADMVGATRFGMKAIFFNPLFENHLWIDEVPVIDKLVELKNYL